MKYEKVVDEGRQSVVNSGGDDFFFRLTKEGDDPYQVKAVDASRINRLDDPMTVMRHFVAFRDIAAHYIIGGFGGTSIESVVANPRCRVTSVEARKEDGCDCFFIRIEGTPGVADSLSQAEITIVPSMGHAITRCLVRYDNSQRKDRKFATVQWKTQMLTICDLQKVDGVVIPRRVHFKGRVGWNAKELMRESGITQEFSGFEIKEVSGREFYPSFYGFSDSIVNAAPTHGGSGLRALIYILVGVAAFGVGIALERRRRTARL